MKNIIVRSVIKFTCAFKNFPIINTLFAKINIATGISATVKLLSKLTTIIYQNTVVSASVFIRSRFESFINSNLVMTATAKLITKLTGNIDSKTTITPTMKLRTKLMSTINSSTAVTAEARLYLLNKLYTFDSLLLSDLDDRTLENMDGTFLG